MQVFKIKKMDLLIAFYIASIVLAELMGGKVFQITENIRLFENPLGTSVAVFLIPLIFSINDIIIEVHGKERMKSIARSGLLIVAFIFLFTTFATTLPTADRSFISSETYNEVFLTARRIAFASLCAFAISIFSDILIFARIREKLKAYGLWFRNNISNLLAQFVDTTVFMYLAYFSIAEPNHNFLWSIIIPYWIYKSLMSIAVTPLVYAGVKWLKEE